MEAAPHLSAGRIAPAFTLVNSAKGKTGLWQFKQRKNLVLYFFDAESELCRRALEEFAANYFSYRSLDAEIFGISPQGISTLRQRVVELELPYQLLSDIDGKVAERYGLRRADAKIEQAVFLLDRFNAIEQIWFPGKGAPDQKDIIASLELVQMRCPE